MCCPGARDARNGLAQVDAATGATSRAVDAAAVAAFLDADVVEFKTSKASKVSTAQDLMLAEFVRRESKHDGNGPGRQLWRRLTDPRVRLVLLLNALMMLHTF